MKKNIFLNVIKLFLLVSFLTLFSFKGYAQSGLNEKGELITDALKVIDKNGAKGNGTARDQYGRIISMPIILPEMRLCDGTQPTVIVDVVSPSGKTWMDRNLGAGRAAIDKNDFYAYGCSYQWGRGNDGHASINWTSATAGTPVNAATSTQNDAAPGNAFITRPIGGANKGDWRVTASNTLWNGVNAVNNPCPSGYRVPTSAEFSAEATTTETAWLRLKLPYGGIRNANSNTVYVYDGSLGIAFYWTSLTTGTDAWAFVVNYNGGYAEGNQKYRADSYPVRCIKN